MGGRWSGRNTAWPLGGQPRFMGLDFYRLGRGPRQELWSLTHKTSRHESPSSGPPRPVGGEGFTTLAQGLEGAWGAARTLQSQNNSRQGLHLSPLGKNITHQ